MIPLVFLLAQTVITPPPGALERVNANSYNNCTIYAQQQSGYRGGSSNGENAPLRGAAGGALMGAAVGSMGGGNAGQGAAIGAGFGLIAGVARKNQAQRTAQNQETNYYNALNACLASGH